MASFRELLDKDSQDLYHLAKEAEVDGYTRMNKTRHAAALADESIPPDVVELVDGKKSEVADVCRRLGLSPTGSKADLQDRIVQDALQGASVSTAEGGGVDSTGAAGATGGVASSGSGVEGDGASGAVGGRPMGGKPGGSPGGGKPGGDTWGRTFPESALEAYGEHLTEKDWAWLDRFPPSKYREGLPENAQSPFDSAEERQDAIIELARAAAVLAVQNCRSFVVVENVDPEAKRKLDIRLSSDARKPTQVVVFEASAPQLAFPTRTDST